MFRVQYSFSVLGYLIFTKANEKHGNIHGKYIQLKIVYFIQLMINAMLQIK